MFSDDILNQQIVKISQKNLHADLLINNVAKSSESDTPKMDQHIPKNLGSTVSKRYDFVLLLI